MAEGLNPVYDRACSQSLRIRKIRQNAAVIGSLFPRTQQMRACFKGPLQRDLKHFEDGSYCVTNAYVQAFHDSSINILRNHFFLASFFAPNCCRPFSPLTTPQPALATPGSGQGQLSLYGGQGCIELYSGGWRGGGLRGRAVVELGGSLGAKWCCQTPKTPEISSSWKMSVNFDFPFSPKLKNQYFHIFDCLSKTFYCPNSTSKLKISENHWSGSLSLPDEGPVCIKTYLILK